MIFLVHTELRCTVNHTSEFIEFPVFLSFVSVHVSDPNLSVSFRLCARLSISWRVLPYVSYCTSIFFVDPEFLYNLFQIKPTRYTLPLSILTSISLHVSGNHVPIIKRNYCIYAVFFTLSGLLVGMRLSLIRTAGWDETQVSSQLVDQIATHRGWKIPVSHRYSKFSWWWAHGCPKHVEKLK